MKPLPLRSWGWRLNNVSPAAATATYTHFVLESENESFSLSGYYDATDKDASGTILWSWHIWLTDKPEDQVYKNNAGTMMDRNLGATSATPGDVKALGLLYQWGRKDPFLNSSSISCDTRAKYTLNSLATTSSSASNGTIAYAISHPAVFIELNVTPNLMREHSGNDLYSGNEKPSKCSPKSQNEVSGNKSAWFCSPTVFFFADGQL